MANQCGIFLAKTAQKIFFSPVKKCHKSQGGVALPKKYRVPQPVVALILVIETHTSEMEKSCNFKLTQDTNIEIVQAFFMENIDEYLSTEEEIEFYLPRESPEFVNYKETTWGKWLNNPKLED